MLTDFKTNICAEFNLIGGILGDLLQVGEQVLPLPLQVGHHGHYQCVPEEVECPDPPLRYHREAATKLLSNFSQLLEDIFTPQNLMFYLGICQSFWSQGQ